MRIFTVPLTPWPSRVASKVRVREARLLVGSSVHAVEVMPEGMLDQLVQSFLLKARSASSMPTSASCLLRLP